MGQMTRRACNVRGVTHGDELTENTPRLCSSPQLCRAVHGLCLGFKAHGNSRFSMKNLNKANAQYVQNNRQTELAGDHLDQKHE